MKIIFAGTPDFAARHLQALLASEHEIVAVYTQPDRPAGRGKKLQASSVKQLALQHDLAIFQPLSLKDQETQLQLAQLNADIMVVVAYGLILPQVVLDTPRYGCLNVHGSLLPRWRGAAPIQRAIWAGDNETGVTIMQMDKGLDTGAMLLKRAISIEESDTSASLYDKLAAIGPEVLIETLGKLHTLDAQIQDNSLASYADKLSKQEAQIDWKQSAAQLARNVKAFNPWPVAFFKLDDVAIKVWEVQVIDNKLDASSKAGQILKADKAGLLIATGEHCLLIKSLQLPGKKPMSMSDVLNGRAEQFSPGRVISS